MTRPRGLEWWISIVRLGAAPFAALQVATTDSYPGGTERALAWAFVGVLAVGGAALFTTVKDDADRRFVAVAMIFDFAIVSAFTILYAFEIGTPTRQLLLVIPILGAIRFGMTGGIALALAITPIAAAFEELRSDRYAHVRYRLDFVTFELGLALIIALLVGWLVNRLNAERVHAEQRAAEAEALRDELGRRADLLDAANRCARALSSSLDLDEAFGAFIRELRGLLPFDRMAIVLAEEEGGRVIATAGEEADAIMPPGTTMALEDNLLADIVAVGQTRYRPDMTKREYAEERWMSDLGLRSRVAAPLLVGARTIGLISLVRRQVDAFTEHEIELVGLLGRLVASAVQNIRAYEGERRTVEELRRLSALRADFVSLVSHELRSPMAAVIGAARTLQQRWRELQPEQRESFLALIGDETNRLAALIGDVLDTSRIDAGTFTYRFTDVDVATLVADSVATAALGQDEVPVVAKVDAPLPHIRADADRLRQIVANLVDNAVKYSPAGRPVEVRVAQRNGAVVVSVTDRGPGIRAEDQRLIFEKFGRVADGSSKPGTGLGLFIARSIAEAHGGEISVSSAPGRGSTFSVKLPI